MQRRHFLHLLAATLLVPINALAAIWNKAAFEATQQQTAIKNLAIETEIASADIEIIAPNYAENGAVVQVEVISKIANTEAIAILVEKNPTPLIANFMLHKGVLPHVITRIKMAESSEVKAIVKAGNQYYKATRFVEVSVGGCG